MLGDRKHAWPGDDRGVPAPAPSGYRTSYNGPLGEKRIETKSEYSREYVSGYLRSLGTNLQVIISQEGTDLVIDEKIPNDCCPTNNYTWIAADSSGKLKATYFQLPQMPTPGSPEMGDLPRVTGIRKGILSYRYPEGAQGTVKFSELKKVDRPGPPG